MKCLWLLLTTLLVPVHLAGAWPPKYAVDCPAQCDSNQCKTSQRCKQTVLDDCGCCRVCAAAAGERCYRTVSGVDGAKCGPGLQCQFSNLQDVFGEEFGICKDHDMASGDGNSVKEQFVKKNGTRSPVMKWLNPR
ncbi:endothelial cell-specific molecule 1 isoform X2 [Gracilinanus agilis]|uniref:endothelial cell-specific molecule 1 isoform X2 n=1 Tax=Gracilinanus agilis TaxID=191870 RepID=UPI001CFD43C8|nr:endothelial cell-specific molecule 1 isoform X2 [Gracilinanus agilis]